jgi:ATP-dependent DNA helicase PIF1
LLITATIGTAAAKIEGRMIHSAIGMRKKGDLPVTPSNKSEQLWQSKKYLIVDEISILDKSVMSKIHTQLTRLKSNPDALFGGVNILWAGDFLQLPSVGGSDLYISGNASTEQGHIL